MEQIKLLDCTLRDGGYINDWKFGRRTIQNVIAPSGGRGDGLYRGRLFEERYLR